MREQEEKVRESKKGQYERARRDSKREQEEKVRESKKRK